MSRFLLAFPLAVIWIILSNHASLESFVIGYVLSLMIIQLLLKDSSLNLKPTRVVGQFVALVIYSVVLSRDILLSGIDVALRAVSLRPLKPGIIAVPVQDKRSVIAGLSAHGITITPGELVVDFDEDKNVMYVHCLDTEHAVNTLDADQAKRLKMFRRILGDD